MPDGVFEAARAQFDERELVYLVAGIGLINMWNRFGVTFQLAPPSALAHARQSHPWTLQRSTRSPSRNGRA